MKLINPIKNIITLLILTFIIFISCATDNNKTSQKKLAESRTTKYKYVDGEIDSTGTLYEKIIYNNLGRDSIIENYDGNGSLYLRTFLYYDSTGNKIKSVDCKTDGEVESTTSFKYSNDGNLIERNRPHVNGGFHRGKFIYNEKGERF